jgi:hypothetical protein
MRAQVLAALGPANDSRLKSGPGYAGQFEERTQQKRTPLPASVEGDREILNFPRTKLREPPPGARIKRTPVFFLGETEGKSYLRQVVIVPSPIAPQTQPRAMNAPQ